MSFPNLFALNCAKFPHNCANAKEALEATREDSFFALIALAFIFVSLLLLLLLVVVVVTEARPAKSDSEKFVSLVSRRQNRKK
jgi:ABC-type phosphate transport system permease subunit